MKKLSVWLNLEYEKWRDGDVKKTLSDFAAFLDVPPTSLSNWINANSKMRADTVAKIAAKLGPEIYDVLGLQRPNYNIRQILEAQGYAPELADVLANVLNSSLSRISAKGISMDSPEALEIIKLELAKFVP